MDIHLDVSLADGYKSRSQRARVITEGWFAKSMYCPVCPSPSLTRTTDGTRVVDFLCPRCASEFQLKSASSRLGRKMRDAGYKPMIERVLAGRSPHFAFLHYDALTWTVRNLFLVPQHFITPRVIERCAPLAPSARRAGWIGCNILTGLIPRDGLLSAVADGNCLSTNHVRDQWARFSWLAEKNVDARGWLADVLRCVRRLERTFALPEVYRFEEELAAAHPGNRNIRPKIRQQLQVLRDRGIIRFLGKGRYEAL